MALQTYNFLLLRTPSHGTDCLRALNNGSLRKDTTFFSERLRKIFSNPKQKEAVYLASQNLYNELNKWLGNEDFDTKRQEKLFLSLYKYFIRMSTRSTPYGLFAGCEVGSISNHPTTINLGTSRYKHARLDMNVLAKIIDRILNDPIIRMQAKFYPNNSLYASDDAYRYVTYTLKNEKRSYHLSSVRKTPYLEYVLTLAQAGECITELAILLVERDGKFTEEEATAYIEQMIAAQLLVSELAPTVTGQEGLPRLVSQLKQLQGTEFYVKALTEIENLLTHQGYAIEQYEQVQSIINRHFTQIPAKHLVQTDLFFRAESINVHAKQVDRLVNDAEKLLYLASQEDSLRLESFRKKFKTKFGEQAVPLAVALDSELGVGYGLHTNGISDNMPLLEGVRVPGKEEVTMIGWGKFTQLKYHKLIEAIAHQTQTIYITDNNLEKLQPEAIPTQKLPNSMYLFGSFLTSSAVAFDKGDYTFLFKALSGPSAANLMGRFCHGSEALNAKLQTLLKEERQMHPDKVYAEIVHLPQARTGNILLRPAFSEYEIPYLGQASVTKENQLPIDDLLVSCRHDTVALRSKKLNKEVVPRLTTAHNISRGLPVYKFLGDLQFQGKLSGASWQWAPFDKEPFLPRIVYKNIIVSRARWYWRREEYATLLANQGSDLRQAFRKIRAARKMPRYVALTAGDNELMIDLECLPALQTLKEKWAKSNVVLYEFLQTRENCLVSGEQGKHTHEVIIPLKKSEQPQKTATSQKAQQIRVIQRNFPTGSEWLYVKIYTGNKNADRILTEVIKPLTAQLIAQQAIDQWFFIRYADPDRHLRVRFYHQENPDFWKPILEQLHQQLAPYLEAGVVHKIQTDTYQRELERYGSTTMTLSEQLFFYDSEAVVRFLDLIEGAKGERYRWLFALRGVDELLNDFGYATRQKSELLQCLQQAFFQENHGNDNLRHSLNDKYRADRQAIAEILNPEKDTDYILPAVDCFRVRSIQSQPIITSLKEACSIEADVPLANLLPSYIHMFLNRMYLSKPRLHELVTYHYLMKHYRSQVAQEKNKVTPQPKTVEV